MRANLLGQCQHLIGWDRQDPATHAQRGQLLVLALRGRFKVETPRRVRLEHLPSEVAEGLRWLWRQQLLRTLSLVLGLLDHTLVAQNSVVVLFVQERLGLDAAGYGVLVSLYGAGGLLGSVAAPKRATPEHGKIQPRYPAPHSSERQCPRFVMLSPADRYVLLPHLWPWLRPSPAPG